MTPGDARRAFSHRWPSARALLIALAIAAGLVDGAPIPTPRVMEHLPQALQTISLRLRDAQAFLLAPFRPVKETFGINQRWALFSSTGPIRHRMSIEARRGEDPWTLLYRAQDDEHTFLRDTLEYRRVRNVWNPNRRGAKPLYPAFATWMASRIFAERPSFDQVRISMDRVTVLDRLKGYESTGDIDDVIELQRSEVLR